MILLEQGQELSEATLQFGSFLQSQKPFIARSSSTHTFNLSTREAEAGRSL